MRGRHLSLVLLVPTVLAIGTAQASSIDQSPRRFASFSSPYVLPTAVGSIGTLDLPSSPDNWLGGTGNWSNGADWSSGLPGSNDDVSINTGNDNVTLDTSSSINSLTLGGTGGSSRLTGDGNAHTLTIAGALTINQSGNLYLSDDTMTAGASSTNLGTASLEFGSSLQINGDVNNSATLNMGQGLSSSNNSLNVTGTLTNTGTVNIGHFSFTSIGGGTATVGGLSNSGTINLGGESTLQVNGNATNSGVVSLDVSTALSVTGNLINSGTLEILSDDNGIAGQVSIVGTLTNTSTGLVMVGGDVARATVGTLVNQGAIGIDAGFASSAVFAIAGDATNSGSIGFGSEGTNHLTVGGALTNNAGATLDFEDISGTASLGSLANAGTITLGGGHNFDFDFDVSGGAVSSGTITANQFVQMQAASLSNSGSIQLNLGSTLQVSGDVSNSGTIATANSEFGGHYFGNTVNIAGKLTNGTGGTFSLGSVNDAANIGYISNAGTILLATGTNLNVNGGSHAATNALPGFLNTGTVDISSGGTLASPLTYTQTSGQTTVDGTLRVSSRGTINLAGGSVYGDEGTIQGTIVSNAAINIGDSPLTIGQLAFNGNFTQGANGSLTFDIAGPASGQYDQLNVSGHAQLNGLMTVDLLHGYVPQIGNNFDIMNFASESGMFSMVVGLPINGQEHFVLEYNSTNLMLDVVQGQLSGQPAASGTSPASEPFITISQEADGYSLTASNNGTPSPTPEPGSILLFGSGAIAVAGRLRRRW